MVVGMFIKDKNMTQMSLFESGFGNWNFWQEIMCGDSDSRVDVMWLNAWNLRGFKDLSLMGGEFIWKK